MSYYSSFGPGFGAMETLFPILFFLIFGIIVAVILVGVVRGLSQWHSNNESPVLTVEAEVVAKRADVSHNSHHDANGMDPTAPVPPTTPPSRWRAGTALSCTCPTGSTVCWWRGTGEG